MPNLLDQAGVRGTDHVVGPATSQLVDGGLQVAHADLDGGLGVGRVQGSGGW